MTKNWSVLTAKKVRFDPKVVRFECCFLGKLALEFNHNIHERNQKVNDYFRTEKNHSNPRK